MRWGSRTTSAWNYRAIYFLCWCIELLVLTTAWDILDPLALQSPKEWRVPDPPENVRYKATPTSITLWWDPPSTAEEVLVRGYTLSYGLETSSRKIVIEGPNTNSFIVEPLKPNTTYVFSLTAYNEAEGEDSTRVLLTASTLPGGKSTDSAFGLLAPIDIKTKPTKQMGELLVSWNDSNPPQAGFRSALTTVGGYDSSTASPAKRPHYVVQYTLSSGRGSSKRTTSERTTALLKGLKPGEAYDITVRVVKPGGHQSAWSAKHTAVVPSVVDHASKQQHGHREFCDFESFSICDFINDASAQLQWSKQPMPPQGHSMVLEVTSSETAPPSNQYGRLLSPVYDLVKSDHVCLSFRYLVRPASYGGVLKVSVLFETDDTSKAVVLFRKSVEKAQTSWQNVSLEARTRPRQGFQIVIEGIRSVNTVESDFLIAVDDIQVVAEACPEDERYFGTVAEEDLMKIFRDNYQLP
ncbi:fibronectin type III domain-containing protein [Ditylenchus destructor]|nr:fibronectin type III domain-containing protein [Ditylenchus destructor]